MSVREATEADLPRLLDLMGDFHRASTQVRMPLNLPKVAAMLRQCLTNPMLGAWVWDAEGAGVQGFYLGRVNDWWFTDELVAFDIAVFIDEAHRGSGAAGALFEAFLTWAKAQGAQTVFPGISTGFGLERAARFYEAHGMTKVGYVFFGDLTAEA